MFVEWPFSISSCLLSKSKLYLHSLLPKSEELLNYWQDGLGSQGPFPCAQSWGRACLPSEHPAGSRLSLAVKETLPRRWYQVAHEAKWNTKALLQPPSGESHSIWGLSCEQNKIQMSGLEKLAPLFLKSISWLFTRPETLGSPCKDLAGATDYQVIPCVLWAWASGDIVFWLRVAPWPHLQRLLRAE